MIAEHASSALSRLAGWRGVPSQSHHSSQLGYPFLESELALRAGPVYEFVGIGSRTVSDATA